MALAIDILQNQWKIIFTSTISPTGVKITKMKKNRLMRTKIIVSFVTITLYLERKIELANRGTETIKAKAKVPLKKFIHKNNKFDSIAKM